MFHLLVHWHCHKFFRIHRPHFWAWHIALCWLPPHLDRAVRALSSAKSGLWYVRHRLTVSDCKPLGPDELWIRRCVSSQLGCVYTTWTYQALSGTCIIHFFKPQICQPPHLWFILLFWYYVNKTFRWLISFFFFFLTFPSAVLAEANSVTAQNIQISPSHKDSCSHVNQKYIFASLEPCLVWNLWLIILYVGTMLFSLQ